MTTRARPAGRQLMAALALILLAGLAIGLQTAGTAAAASPSLESHTTSDRQSTLHVPGAAPAGQLGAVFCSSTIIDAHRLAGLTTWAAAAKAQVNWKWIAIGVGGAVLLLAFWWILQRRMPRK